VKVNKSEIQKLSEHTSYFWSTVIVEETATGQKENTTEIYNVHRFKKKHAEPKLREPFHLGHLLKLTLAERRVNM